MSEAQWPEWQKIETAPMDADILLASFCVAHKRWELEVGWAGASNTKPLGMSNAWLHGSATHWLPLPPPPKEEA